MNVNMQVVQAYLKEVQPYHDALENAGEESVVPFEDISMEVAAVIGEQFNLSDEEVLDMVLEADMIEFRESIK